MRLSRLLFILPFVLLFIGFFHPITAYDQDLGRHILTGEIIVKTLHVPTINLFSYTYPTFPFINHHWGSEVVFYLIKTSSSNFGLFILSLLLIFLAFGLIFFQAQKKAQALPILVVSILYLRILFERTDLRPELFSFLFLSLMVTLLYRYKERFSKAIFLLIPLELLWTNMHIYFPIGVLITLLFVIDEIIMQRKNLFNRHTKTLVLVFLLMGSMTLINPHFLTGALYPFRVFQNYGYTIEENQTPFFLQSLGFSKPSFLYLEISIAVLFGSLLLTCKKTRPIDWFLAVTFTFVALSAVRNFPLFVFATFIPCSYTLSQLLKPLGTLLLKKPPIWIGTVLLIILFFFGWQVRSTLALQPFGYGVDEDGKQALDFVQKEHISGPIFNNFDIGSYIESRLYPNDKVFIDGRPEAYPASFIQNIYIKMQQDPAVFTKISNHYHFTTIIFSHTDQTPWAQTFLSSIVHNPQWSTVYLDPMMIILVKHVPQNQTLIANYGMTPDTFSMILPNDEKQLRQVANFYSVVSLPKQFEAVLLKLINLKPNDCAILGNLTSLYTQENNSAAQIYENRYQTMCTQ